MKVETQHIGQGFLNLIKKNVGKLGKEREESAQHKAAVCKACPFMNNYRCTKCGCYLPAKLLSNSKCPLNKF